jgi:hypothetical protein
MALALYFDNARSALNWGYCQSGWYRLVEWFVQWGLAQRQLQQV